MDGEARPDRLEKLDATLEHLERLCGRLEHAERQFKQLTDECQGVLQGLVTVDRRHATAVAGLNDRLGDWCNLESKLLEESARRIEQFERGVSHEWMVLRQLNEEPIAEMREQADALRRTCLEAARTASLRLQAAEQAYAAHAAALEQRMAEWQRRWLDAATSSPALAAAAGTVEPWPLEGVAQLHQELRAAPIDPPGPVRSRALVPRQPIPRAGVSENQAATGAVPLQSSPVPRPPEVEAEAGAPPPRSRRRLLLAAGLLAVTVLVASLFAVSYRPAPAAPPPRPETASGQLPDAAADAAREREERLAEAQRLVERAGSMVDILAAPDLLRYGLTGTGPAADAYAQVLWSRSRGVAVTASRLPAPPAGQVYTMWVISDARAAAVGRLLPDATGRASLVLPGPLTLPRLVSLRVTLEPETGADQPGGVTCLAGGRTS